MINWIYFRQIKYGRGVSMLKNKRKSGIKINTLIKATTVQTMILFGIYLFTR